MLSPCLKNRPNLQVPYLRLGFHSSYKRSQLSQDQSIGIRFAKYQIFLIWYTKHQKTTNIRYVKILNDMVQAYVVIFFFFFISKNDIYTKGYSMHEEHRANRENTREGKQRETKKKTKQQKNYKKEKDQRKEGRESLDVSLHARDQLKRVPLKEASIRSLKLSKSLKVLQFCSFQIYHRMHKRTKFQI